MLVIFLLFGVIQFNENTVQNIQAAAMNKEILLWDVNKDVLNPAPYSTNENWISSLRYKLVFGGTTWRVLNTSETGFGQSNGLLLMNDTVLPTKTAFNAQSSSGNNYSGSAVETVVDTLANTYFSGLTALENQVIVPSSSSSEYTLDDLTFKDNVNNKKWFAPTAKMMSTTAYGYPNNKTSSLNRNFGGSTYTWLSSADKNDSAKAAYINNNGEISPTSVTSNIWTMAAMQIDSKSVLFSSNSNGKLSNAVGPGAMKQVGSRGKEAKLTLKDPAQEIKDTSATINSTKDVITINYSKTGPGTSLSAMAVNDANDVFYYGRLADLPSGDYLNQTVTMTVPPYYNDLGLKLKIFTENYNGNSKTDYASNIVDVPVTVEKTVSDVSINYMDATGNLKTELFKDVNLGTNLTETQKYKDIVNTVPNGYRKATPFWTFTNGANEDDFKNVRKDFSATANYIKNLNNTMIWNDSTKTNLQPASFDINRRWRGSKIYWGTYNSTPQKWRILNTSETGYGKSDAGGGVLIMSEDKIQRATKFYDSKASGNAYMGSKLESYIDTAFNTNLVNQQEKQATLLSSKSKVYEVVNAANPIDNINYKDEFSNKKWFAPTAEILTTPAYGFPSTSDPFEVRVFGNQPYIWLASVNNDISNEAGYNNNTGWLRSASVDLELDVLMTSQIDPNAIVLVSNAVNGKQTNAAGKDALKNVENNYNEEYKLTVKDTNQILDIISYTIDDSNVASIKYNKTGNGTTLSGVIVDSVGNIISYGRFATLPSGTVVDQMVQVQLPANYSSSNYQLKLFTEIYHDDKQTDFASEMKAVKAVGDIVLNYQDASGVGQSKVFKNVVEGVDLTKKSEFQKILNIAAPDGYRKADNFWTFDNGASEADFKNITKAFTATANYVKTWKVTFQTWDGNPWLLSPWKDGPVIVDNGSGLSESQIPQVPTRNSYTFLHWDQDIGNITKDIIVRPVYTKNQEPTPNPTPNPKPKPKPNPINGVENEEVVEENKTDETKKESVQFEGIVEENFKFINRLGIIPTKNKTQIKVGEGNIIVSVVNGQKSIGSIPDTQTFINGIDKKLLQNVMLGDTLEIRLTIEVDKNPTKNKSEKDILQNNADNDNVKVGKYLDITVERRVNNQSWFMVNQMENEVPLSVNIPVELQGKEEYSVLRVHNQEYRKLKNSSTDKTSVVFKTNKFSTYAIAYTENKSQNYWWYLLIIILVILVLAIGRYLYSRRKKEVK